MTKSTLFEKVGQELAQCYSEHPLRINDKKLSSLRPDTQFTTSQIAWFFALIKIKIETIDSIKWEASDLISCMCDLENAFSILAEEFLREQQEDTRDDVQWEESIITKIDNNLSTPIYVLSRPVFFRIFAIWSSENGDINPSKINDMNYRQQASMEKVRLLGLYQRNMTDHLRDNIHVLCKNNPVRLSLDKIPETIWLKDLAHYLAITAKKLNDYGDVDYGSSSLLQNAKRIHDLLQKALKASLRIYWVPFRHMKPEHRELAEQLGVIQYECYGNNPERDYLDNKSALVSRDLAITLLNYHDELSNLVFSFCNVFTKAKAASYKGDAINIAIVQYVLPELFPRKNEAPYKELGWSCFIALPDVLNRLGADVTMHDSTNKKEWRVEGTGKQRETIKIDYDAFRKRFDTLFNAYLYNASCEEIEY